MKRAILAASVALLSACASTKPHHLTTKDFSERAPDIRKIGVVVAEAQIFEVGAGNSVELHPEKTSQCRACLEAAAPESFSASGFSAVLIPVDDDVRPVLADFQPWHAIVRNAYQKEDLEAVVPLASAQALASSREVDAIAFVSLRDHVQSAGRKVVSGLSAMMGFGVSRGIAAADIVLVDAGGRVVYYDIRLGTGYNFTDDSDVLKVTRELTAGLGPRPGAATGH